MVAKQPEKAKSLDSSDMVRSRGKLPAMSHHPAKALVHGYKALQISSDDTLASSDILKRVQLSQESRQMQNCGF